MDSQSNRIASNQPRSVVASWDANDTNINNINTNGSPSITDGYGPPLGGRTADAVGPETDPLIEEAARAERTQQVFLLYWRPKITEDDIQEIHSLVQQGIDVNRAEHDGNTPLHFAAINGHTEVVKTLLAAPGIAVNQANMNGVTPLLLAARDGHMEVVQALLAVPGIAVNQANSFGGTPLHWAASYGRTEVVCLLLEHTDAAGQPIDWGVPDWRAWLNKNPNLDRKIIVPVLVETHRLSYTQMLSEPKWTGYWVKYQNDSRIAIDWTALKSHVSQIADPIIRWFMQTFIDYKCTSEDARIAFLETAATHLKEQYVGPDKAEARRQLTEYMEAYAAASGHEGDSCLLIDLIQSVFLDTELAGQVLT